MDRLTGLGQTFEEFVRANEVTTAYQSAEIIGRAYRGSTSACVEMGALAVDDGFLYANGEQIAKMDDLCYGKVCSLLDIPTAYLLKLPDYMRNTNINYWFRANDEKDVTVVYRDGELLEIKDGDEISIARVFEVIAGIIPDAILMRTVQQTNSTMFDFIEADEGFDLCGIKHYAGIRFVHKEGLKAPEISPILMNCDSCAIIEFGDVFEKLNIKNMLMSEIMDSIEARINECRSYVADADKLGHILEQNVPNPRRRINLYCKEHNIPDRIRHRVLDCFDDLSWRGNFTLGEIVSVLSGAGFLETVKQSSERKLQSLAGYVITKSQYEHRCEKCDSKTDED